MYRYEKNLYRIVKIYLVKNKNNPLNFLLDIVSFLLKKMSIQFSVTSFPFLFSVKVSYTRLSITCLFE